MENNIKTILKKLIAFETITSNKLENYECLKYVSTILEKYDIPFNLSSHSGYYNLTSVYFQSRKIDFAFIGHVDVVPVESTSAFTPYEKDGRIYGRGAIDMKGEIAAMLNLYTSLYNMCDVNLSFVLTSDEEIGGFNGVKYLVDTDKIAPKCAIIPDSGFPNALSINEKGIIHVCVTAKGVAAHGSRPWLGVNAIEQLMTCYLQIKKLMPKYSAKNNWVPTVNLGQIVGGNATNSVPETAFMNLDFRYRDKTDYKFIMTILNRAANGSSVRFEIKLSGDPVIVNTNNKYFKKMQRIGKKFGIIFKKNLAHGASDARHLSKLNIPLIMFRPDGSEAHVVDEWVDIKSLQIFANILKEFIIAS